VAAIIGAAIGAYSKAVSSKHKILELRESYENRLQDNYLENARKYTESVYAPMSIALSELTYEFRKFRARKESDSESKHDFSEAIQRFNVSVESLMAKGVGAFLTADLDERLQSFCSFLEESKTANVPTLKVVLGFSLPFFGSGYSDRLERRMTGKFARSLWSPRISLSLGGLGMSYEAREILAAPLTSRDFEERFVADSYVINVLIKEVTLGAKAKHILKTVR